MNIRFIKSSEKKEIIDKLKKQFGIEKLNYLLIETGKERMRAFSGSLSKDEIMELSEIANIEIIGLYILRQEHDLRLSFDATQLLAKQITKNIVNISEEQYKEWIRGFDILEKAPSETVVISYNGDYIGCGKSAGDKIANHVPKERRLKK